MQELKREDVKRDKILITFHVFTFSSSFSELHPGSESALITPL